jgi:hypothetical protein
VRKYAAAAAVGYAHVCHPLSKEVRALQRVRRWTIKQHDARLDESAAGPMWVAAAPPVHVWVVGVDLQHAVGLCHHIKTHFTCQR